MIIETSEPSKDIVKKQLLIFEHYQVDANEIICPLQLCEKYEVMFPIVGFLAQQIFKIIGSQIKIERIFSLVGILTNLKNGIYS